MIFSLSDVFNMSFSNKSSAIVEVLLFPEPAELPSRFKAWVIAYKFNRSGFPPPTGAAASGWKAGRYRPSGFSWFWVGRRPRSFWAAPR